MVEFKYIFFIFLYFKRGFKLNKMEIYNSIVIIIIVCLIFRIDFVMIGNEMMM